MDDSLENSQSHETRSESPPPDGPSASPATPSPTKKYLGRAFDVLSWGVLIAVALHFFFRDEGGPRIGSEAPEHTLLALDSGEQVAFPEAIEAGHPILIKAFASWCGACKRSTWLEDFTDLDASKDLQFMAVSVDDDSQDAIRAKEEWPIRAPVFFDSTGAFSRDYEIRVLPTYILLDANHRVLRVTSGLPGPLDFRAWKAAGKK